MSRRACPCNINALDTTLNGLRTRLYALKPGIRLGKSHWDAVIAQLNMKRSFTAVQLSQDLTVLTVSVGYGGAWVEGAHQYEGELLDNNTLVWYLIADQIVLQQMAHAMELEQPAQTEAA